MNKSAKILMLMAAIVIAVAAVLYYAKQITAPPIQTSFPNVHLASLHTDLERLDQHPTLETADSIFDVTLHAARYFQREGLVTITESDDVIAKLTKKYTPFFLKSAREHFTTNTWAENRNDELRRRAKLLNGLRTQEGHKKPILTGEIRDRVDSVTYIIDAYESALNLCERVSFNNLDDAKKRVKEAHDYAKMPKLNNCSTLVATLNALPQRIGESHFDFVKKEVKKMENYPSYSEQEFAILTKKVGDAIGEYEKNAAKTYGINEKTVKDNVKELRERAGKYWEKADSLYKSLKENSSVSYY